MMPNCCVPFLWSGTHLTRLFSARNEVIERALLHLWGTACTRTVVRDLTQVTTGPRFGKGKTTAIVITPFLGIIIAARKEDMASDTYPPLLSSTRVARPFVVVLPRSL